MACLQPTENEFAVLTEDMDDPCDNFPSANNCQPFEQPELPSDPLGEADTEVDPMTEDCDPPMRVRKTIPDNESIAPINTQPIILTIGNGDDSHYDIALLDEQNQPVPMTQESSCYIHESDTEYHCTYLLSPLEYLQPNAGYTIQLLATDQHHTPGAEYKSWFTTSSSIQEMDDSIPEMGFLGYMDREPTAVTTCDWPGAKKYELYTWVANPQSDNLSIVQIYEVHDLNTGAESLEHSIILPRDAEVAYYRQVMKPGTESVRCYRSEHRDIAGNQSRSTPIQCWDGALD